MKLLILGAKEYPLRGMQKDIGGIDFYNQALVEELSKHIDVSIIVRQDNFSKRFEKNKAGIYRVRWVPGFWTKSTTLGINSFQCALDLDFDIILAHGQIATFFGIFLSKIKRKPLVSITHGLAGQQEQYGFLRLVGRVLEKWAFSKPSILIALSENDMVKTKNLNKIVKLIPTGINLQKFTRTGGEKVRKELRISKEKVVILSTSRLIEVKGLRFLIASIKKLKGNFVLLLSGTGPEEAELKELAKECGEKIRFLGFRNDVPSLLAAADIFVLPSISEGMPMGLLEAMASECACVVTDIGLPIKDKTMGIIVPPKNSEALANAIQLLINNSRLRKELGANALKYVSLFTWENVAREFVSLFKNFIRIK